MAPTMNVSLPQFLKTGGFGPVKLGMLKADVLKLLGTPDAIEATARRRPYPRIYLYGNIKFYFREYEPRICSLIKVEMQKWQPPSEVVGNLYFENLELPSAASINVVGAYLSRHQIGVEWRENPRCLIVPTSRVTINLDESDRLWSIDAGLSSQQRIQR